jgi:uroporphyrinogen-III synthase
VEMAVARLRRGLGGGGLVETVVKRGYRLACDPGLTADRPLPTGTAGPGGETGRSR